MAHQPDFQIIHPSKTVSNSTVFKCRSCGSGSGILILDLGSHPLANNLLTNSSQVEHEPKFPLELFVCQDCRLIQIGSIVPPVNLFSEYVYFSSFSDTMLDHSRRAATEYIQQWDLKRGNPLVVEVASNDGYMLKNFVREGIRCLGVEPAVNIAEVAIAAGVPTLEAFFGHSTAQQIVEQHGRADLVMGSNVFAHAPEINDFVAGLAVLISDQGRIALEFPYAMDFLAKNEFDTIYHEHVFYFSLTALLPVFRRHGLEIIDVQRIPIHGGSIRLIACHQAAHTVQDTVQEFLDQETEVGVLTDEFYLAFSSRVEKVKKSLCETLNRLNQEGKRIAAYGASAKGSTLLNSLEAPASHIEFIVDRSSYKHGKLSPGMHLPIYPPERLLTNPPDYVLLLTWNFKEEILKQQTAFRENGGKFIIPIPEVQIV
jgi:hypothetical protein